MSRKRSTYVGYCGNTRRVPSSLHNERVKLATFSLWMLDVIRSSSYKSLNCSLHPRQSQHSKMARTKSLARANKRRSTLKKMLDIVRDIPGVDLVDESTFDPDDWQGVEKPTFYRGTWPPTCLEDLLGSPSELEECARCETTDSCHCSYLKLWLELTWDIPNNFTIEPTLGKGMGLFSRRKFGANAVLGEYTGSLVPRDPTRPDEDTQYVTDICIGKAHLTKGRALAAQSRQAKCWIDAAHTGSIFRFLNHSCDCNAQFWSQRVGMRRRVVMVSTTRPIAAGEEITIDYGEGYWKAGEVCYCGSKNCRSAGLPAEPKP